MIQVLHVLCDYSMGGAERFVHSLCQSYPAHIYPKICTLYRGGTLEKPFRSLGVPLLNCNRTRRRLDVSATLRLARWITESDIVHTHLFAGHFFGRMAAQIASLSSVSRPVISTFHNTHPDSKVRGWILEQTNALSHLNIGISQAVTQTLPHGSQTIYSGIDTTYFSELEHRPVQGRILSIGRLVEQKGFDVLAQAIQMAKRQYPSIQADVLGEGPLRSTLALSELNLLGRHDDVRPFLQKADVFVLPTRWEGLGIVLLEAMAAGVPIITSDLPICREVCGDAAIYVPVDQPKLLAEQIVALLQNQAQKETLRLRGLKRSKKFSIGQSASEYAQLYEQLIASQN